MTAGPPAESKKPAAFFDPFVAALFGTVIVASLWPAPPAAAQGLSRLTQLAIGWLFFLYGVRLPTREALAAVRNWRLQISVLGVTYVLFPALGLVSSLLPEWLLAPQVARGLLYMSLVPSTVQSSIAFTSIAGGNVAGALCAASLSNLLGVLFTPLLAALLLGAAMGLSTESIGAIAGQLVAPFVAGQLCRRWLASWLMRNRRLLSMTDRAAILLVVYVAFSRGVSEGLWSLLAWRDLLVLLGICAVVLTLVFSLTTLIGRALRFSAGDRITLMMCGSKKSLATGLPMAAILLPGASVGLLVLPLMVYHQLQLLVASILAQWLGKKAPPARPPEPD